MQWQLLAGIPPEDVRAVLSLARRSTYRRGEVVFHHHDPADAVHLIAKGRFDIRITAPHGDVVSLAIRGPGDTFGEIAVMDGLPRTANAVALDDSTLIVIQRTDFLPFLETEPRLAIHLLKLMCERLRWTSELVEESAFMDGPARLAKRLLILASLHGRAVRVGHLELRISQAELARFLGITRQIVNQHLADWRRLGWIELGRTQIIIRNTDALRAMIAGGAKV